MKVHKLKLQQPFFDDVFYNRKEFEVRKNDRDFKIGDRLQLLEVVEEGNPQRFVLKDIKYILNGGQYGIDKDYIVLGLCEANILANRVSSSDFRIVERCENEFYIQKLIKKTMTSGFWWWRKTKEEEEWKRVTKYGKESLIYPYFSKISDLVYFTTKEEAVKWIEDFHKYPVYHYC